MTRERKPPVVDIPFDVALEELNGFEVIAINKRFKAHLTDIDPLLAMMAVVWAFENRDGKTRSWESVQGMSQREISEYFADPTGDPDDEQGKG
jgi:hypothetical protein